MRRCRCCAKKLKSTEKKTCRECIRWITKLKESSLTKKELREAIKRNLINIEEGRSLDTPLAILDGMFKRKYFRKTKLSKEVKNVS